MVKRDADMDTLLLGVKVATSKIDVELRFVFHAGGKHISRAIRIWLGVLSEISSPDLSRNERRHRAYDGCGGESNERRIVRVGMVSANFSAAVDYPRLNPVCRSRQKRTRKKRRIAWGNPPR